MKSYQDLLRHVLDHGEHHSDRTGVGTTSVFGYQWRHDLRQGFPLLTTKKIPLRWVFEELRWFLSGSSDAAKLRAEGVDIWDEWATEEQCAKFGRKAGDLGPIYGPMMREFPLNYSGQFRDDVDESVDQIAALLDDIEHSPNSRRLIVTHWHPYYAKRVTLPPCHTLWQVKVHQARLCNTCLGKKYVETPGVDGRILCHCGTGRQGLDEMSLHLYARSIDAFLGLPFNIASYGLLLHMLCAVTGKCPRDLIISFGDLHIYNSHRAAVTEQLSREPRALPNVIVGMKFPHQTALENLLSIEWQDIHLSNYDPHPAISAPVAV